MTASKSIRAITAPLIDALDTARNNSDIITHELPVHHPARTGFFRGYDMINNSHEALVACPHTYVFDGPGTVRKAEVSDAH